MVVKQLGVISILFLLFCCCCCPSWAFNPNQLEGENNCVSTLPQDSQPTTTLSQQPRSKEVEENVCVVKDLSSSSECFDVIGQNVWIEKDGNQNILFEQISLNISDVRMALPRCRRAYIWYTCNTIFPTCDPSNNEVCTPELADCLSVQENCKNFFDFKCDSSSPSPLFSTPSLSSGPFSSTSSSFCNTSVDLELAVSYPIVVSTCLSSPGKEMECCQSPFVRSPTTLECVVKCPQQQFHHSVEVGWNYALFFLTWASTLSIIFCFIPIIKATEWNRFPNYVIMVILVAVNLLQHVTIWSFYVGQEKYLCGDHISLLEALPEFLNSARCRIQLVLIAFLLYTICIWQVVLSLILSAQLFSKNFMSLEMFLPERMTKKKQLILHSIAWGLAILFSITLFFCEREQTLFEPEADRLAFPVWNCCVPTGHNLGYYVFSVPISFMISLGFLLMLLTLLLIVWYDWRLLRVQWRPLTFAVHYLVAETLIQISIFYFSQTWDSIEPLDQYPICTASHPRQSPPPCEREYIAGYWFFCIFSLSTFVWVLVEICFVYLTRPLVFGWWKMVLLREREETIQTPKEEEKAYLLVQ